VELEHLAVLANLDLDEILLGRKLERVLKDDSAC
jgi:hypothetical protein